MVKTVSHEFIELCFFGIECFWLCVHTCVHVCMFAWSWLCFCVCLPINGVKAVSCKWLSGGINDSTFICLPSQARSHTHIVSLSKAVNVIWTRLLRSFILHLHFYPLRTVCVFCPCGFWQSFFFFALLLMWSYLFLTHWHSSCLFFPSYFIIISW